MARSGSNVQRNGPFGADLVEWEAFARTMGSSANDDVCCDSPGPCRTRSSWQLQRDMESARSEAQRDTKLGARSSAKEDRLSQLTVAPGSMRIKRRRALGQDWFCRNGGVGVSETESRAENQKASE